MAKIKFAQMSTKKLTALLETASEEDQVAIRAILESRGALQAQETIAPEDELTDEEKAAIEAAEAPISESRPTKAEETKEKKEKGGRKPSVKMSDEELEAAHEAARMNVGHRVTVMLPGTVVKTGGVITTVLKDKRAMAVYYQIVTDATEEAESRKIYKKYGSSEVQVLDEVVETGKHKEAKMRQKKAKLEAGEWDAEASAVMDLASEHVGKIINLGEEKGLGRIVGILSDKRSCGVYFRIEFNNELGIKKITHKVVKYEKDEDGIKLLGMENLALVEVDEEGEKYREAFRNRRAREPRKVLTAEEKVLAAEEALEKAKKSLEKAQEVVEMREIALQTARAELENKHAAQAKMNGATEDENSGDDLA